MKLRFARVLFCAALLLFGMRVSYAQTIGAPPQNQTVGVGDTVTFGVYATGTPAPTYQWLKNGAVLPGATGVTLTLISAQPSDVGLYTVVVASGANTASASAILALGPSGKVAGAAREVGSNIVHPSGNIYDQVLLEGPAATITADPGQVTRISYIDLNDDIVQLEFAGAGALTVVLDSPTGPAAPVKYNQPTVSYMKGHARVLIGGADETTNVSVFSVGRANAVNQALFKADVAYDGLADIAFLGVTSANGKFGGIRTANASYFATRGLTGVYAPDVQFTGPVFVGDIAAHDAAAPALVLGFGTDVRITGGDLLQANAQPVQVGGFAQLRFTDGATSHGVPLPAQPVQGVLAQGGTDVTNVLSGAKANAALYLARLRPDPAAAASSLGSGYATLAIQADGSALVSLNFSNLSSPEVSAYVRLGTGGDYVLSLGLGQVSGRPWNFGRTGQSTTTDLLYALNNGNLHVTINSAKFPDGELRGNLVVAAGSQTFTAPAPPPALPADALTKPTPTDAARFLAQATFGPTAGAINALTTRGINGWIDDQLALPATSALASLRAEIAAFPNPPIPPALGDERFAWQQNWYATWWKMAVTSPDQLRQRVAFALTEILVIGAQDDLDFNMESKMAYYDLLIKGAFGNYRQMLEDVSTNAAMGIWLSFKGNLKANPVKGTAPDENYAREVQQLFTIGLVQLQPDGTLLLDAAGQPIPTYDQAIVTETAKVFTGWTFADFSPTNTNENSFVGIRPEWTKAAIPFKDTNGWLVPMRCYDTFHDKTAKAIVSLQQVPLAQAVRTTIPAGQTGVQDLKTTLDTLFNHPNTGPFVCRQLIQRLVTSNPSPAYVYRVAQAFANDGSGVRGNLAAVVRAILTDYEARSPAVLGNAGYGKIKEPLIRMTAFLRALNVAAPNGRYMDSYFGESRYSTIDYTPNGFFSWPLNTIAQGPLASPTVFNFFSPTYSPPGPMAAAGLVAPELEITDSNFSIQAPNQLTYLLYRDLKAMKPPPSGPSPFLVVDYSALLPNAKNSAALADQLNLLFCANQMTASTRAQILATLQALPVAATDLERVQTAIHFTIVSPDGALQK